MGESEPRLVLVACVFDDRLVVDKSHFPDLVAQLAWEFCEM